METVRLFVFVFVLALVLSFIYMIIQIILRKKSDAETKDIIKMAITEEDELNPEAKEKLAEKIAKGEASISDTNISADEKKDLIEDLDLKPYTNGKEVAHVFCNGGNNATENFNYKGVNSCAYMNKMYSGVKKCKFACLGCMDCAKVCPTKAIYKNANGVAEIDRSMCIGCGECTKVCPDHIIKMVPVDQEIAPTCRYCISEQNEPNINSVCAVGCNKCGECVKACPSGAIKFAKNGELVVDKKKCTACYKCVEVCPNKTIKRLLTDFDKI